MTLFDRHSRRRTSPDKPAESDLPPDSEGTPVPIGEHPIAEPHAAPGQAVTQRSLPSFARRLEPHASLQDDPIGIPEASRRQLLDLRHRIEQRRRILDDLGFAEGLDVGRCVTGLLAGPLGTGRTLAVSHLAEQLGVAVIRVDLAEVLASEAGLLEDQLQALLDAASEEDALVYIRDAALLFQIAGEEPPSWAVRLARTVWRLIDRFAGAVILGVEQRPSLTALDAQRVQVAIDFPVPDADNMLKILKRAVPPGVTLPSDAELLEIVSRLRLPGGSIPGLVIGAATEAAVRDSSDPLAIRQRDLVLAAAREYLKRGKMVSASEFGGVFYAWVEAEVL